MSAFGKELNLNTCGGIARHRRALVSNLHRTVVYIYVEGWDEESVSRDWFLIMYALMVEEDRRRSARRGRSKNALESCSSGVIWEKQEIKHHQQYGWLIEVP